MVEPRGARWSTRFGRIREAVQQVAGGLTPDQLASCLDTAASSIRRLLWPLTRVENHHIADAAQAEPVWTVGWLGGRVRFAVAAVRIGPDRPLSSAAS